MSESLSLTQKIESLLFTKGEPVEKSFLAEFLSCSEDNLEESLNIIKNRNDTVTTIVESDREVQLVLKADFSSLTMRLHEQEEKQSIGAAGAEVLAIIIYRDKVSKADIDHIRGVNSSHTLRHLLIRGLIEKTGSNPTQYRVTTELLTHMGVESRTKLPLFQSIVDKLDEKEEQSHGNAQT